MSEYQYIPASGTLTTLGASSPGASPVFSGAITPNITNTSKTHNWVVLTSIGALSTFSVGSDGSLSALSSGQYTIQEQPSAIFIK